MSRLYRPDDEKLMKSPGSIRKRSARTGEEAEKCIELSTVLAEAQSRSRSTTGAVWSSPEPGSAVGPHKREARHSPIRDDQLRVSSTNFFVGCGRLLKVESSSPAAVSFRFAEARLTRRSILEQLNHDFLLRAIL